MFQHSSSRHQPAPPLGHAPKSMGTQTDHSLAPDPLSLRPHRPHASKEKFPRTGISLIIINIHSYDRQSINYVPGIHSSVPRSSLCCGPVHYVPFHLPTTGSFEPRCTSLLRGPLALTSWVDSPCTGHVKDGHCCPAFNVTHQARSTSFLFHHEARVSAWRSSRIISWQAVLASDEQLG